MSRLEELRGRIQSRDARIGVIGLGYVGLPLALEFAKAAKEAPPAEGAGGGESPSQGGGKAG